MRCLGSRVIVELGSLDKTRRDIRPKVLLITDVKTLLFLLSELIWIKSDDDLDAMFRGSSAFLKGILNA